MRRPRTEDHIGRFTAERCTKGEGEQPNPELGVERELLYGTYGCRCSDEGTRPAPPRHEPRLRQPYPPGTRLSSAAEMIRNDDRKLYPAWPSSPTPEENLANDDPDEA
ncbi:hypothetical protein AB0L10_22830 [Streptomyces flaveolus]|uniref:hypothetical protein n=1 Tax=Streptomyces flaveolus TaxID=67297 RepID=UPI0034207D72